MISIVVCHRNQKFLDQFKQSVSNTIGIPFELIIINNTTNKYNIFQAYNLGFEQSKFDLICFAHEDIIFHTKDWGKNIIEYFKDPKLGIIGVAGSHYLPKLPGSHWSSGITSYNVIHSIGKETHLDSWRYINDIGSSSQAVLLDGLWLCTSKAVMSQVRFDDKIFSGFHCYDSDICLQIRKLNYDVKIIFDIKIEHFSLGKRDKEWLKNIFIFYNKWKNKLPIFAIEVSKPTVSIAHFSNAKELIEQIKVNKIGLLGILKTWKLYLQCNPPISKMNLLLTLRLFDEKLYLLIARLVKGIQRAIR